MSASPEIVKNGRRTVVHGENRRHVSEYQVKSSGGDLGKSKPLLGHMESTLGRKECRSTRSRSGLWQMMEGESASNESFEIDNVTTLRSRPRRLCPDKGSILDMTFTPVDNVQRYSRVHGFGSTE